MKCADGYNVVTNSGIITKCETICSYNTFNEIIKREEYSECKGKFINPSTVVEV
jgi:hypothetical protein